MWCACHARNADARVNIESRIWLSAAGDNDCGAAGCGAFRQPRERWPEKEKVATHRLQDRLEMTNFVAVTAITK
jgi:hypothetical protein